MKYLVIDLGNFGMTLAQTLTDNGHEVIGVDSDAVRVEMVKDRIAFAYIMDATSAVALRSLPLSDIDYAVVAIGQSMDHSLRAVAALKSLNVETIYARALDTVHKSILEAMNISKIFIPESYAAKLIAQKLNDKNSEALL